jgi:hypothetical protein
MSSLLLYNVEKTLEWVGVQKLLTGSVHLWIHFCYHIKTAVSFTSLWVRGETYLACQVDSVTDVLLVPSCGLMTEWPFWDWSPPVSRYDYLQWPYALRFNLSAWVRKCLSLLFLTQTLNHLSNSNNSTYQHLWKEPLLWKSFHIFRDQWSLRWPNYSWGGLLGRAQCMAVVLLGHETTDKRYYAWAVLWGQCTWSTMHWRPDVWIISPPWFPTQAGGSTVSAVILQQLLAPRQRGMWSGTAVNTH